MMLKKNKKGNGFFAWFFVIIVLLAVSLTMIIINNSWGKIQDPLSDALGQNVNDSDVNVTKILDQTGGATLAFDKLLPFLIIGLFGFVLISAGAILKHPIMIFVGVIVLGVIILIAVVFSNVYQQISATDAFTETDAQMQIQSKFMEYLPSIIFFIAIGVVASLLYGKTQGGSSY